MQNMEMIRFANELTEKQQRELREILNQKFESCLDQKLTDSVTQCPNCNSESHRTAGKARGVQRYKCKDCGKTFGATNKTPFCRTQKELAQTHVHDPAEHRRAKAVEAIDVQLKVLAAAEKGKPYAVAYTHKTKDEDGNRTLWAQARRLERLAKVRLDALEGTGDRGPRIWSARKVRPNAERDAGMSDKTMSLPDPRPSLAKHE